MSHDIASNDDSVQGFPTNLPEDPTESFLGADPISLKGPGLMSDQDSFYSVSAWNEPATVGTIDDSGSDSEVSPSRPGHSTFLLRRCIGVGGFGEVWEAEQTSLDRMVAVKKIQDLHYIELQEDEEQRLRLENQFRQEAQITAQLDHPNIVPVYDLGQDEAGRPALAMKLVKGKPWNHILFQDFYDIDEDDYYAKHLPIFLDMLQAVAFAHSRGIVHRDLKPSQMLIGNYGETLLMDWGLALYVGRVASDDYMTPPPISIPTVKTAHNPAGTPSLMAPEQTLENAFDISHRTDVYLLGGTLYFLLTGTYPHDAETSLESMKLARIGNVEEPKKRTPTRHIPEDLAILTMECLESDPDKRIGSVEEMIDRIRAYQSGASRRSQSEALTIEIERRLLEIDPEGRILMPGIEAERVLEAAQEDSPLIYRNLSECLGLVERAAGLWPQNPNVDRLRLSVFWSYVIVAIIEEDLTLARTLANRLDDPQVTPKLLQRVQEHERTLDNSKRQRYILSRALGLTLLVLAAFAVNISIQQQFYAFNLVQKADIQSTLLKQAQKARERADASRRQALSAKAQAQRESYYATINRVGRSVDQLQIQQAKDLILRHRWTEFAGWEWGFLLQRLYPETMRLQGMQAFHATFSPDDSQIFIAGVRKIAAWNASDGTFLWEKDIHNGAIWTVQISPKADCGIAVSFDKTATIFDTETGRVIHRLPASSEILRAAAFSPSGELVATGGTDTVLRIWNVESGELVKEIDDFAEDIYDVTFSDDGNYIAVGNLDNSARVFDAKTYEELHRWDFERNVLALDFFPDSSRLAVSNTNDELVVVDVASGEILLEAVNPEPSYFHHVDVSPDGTMIAASDDKGICTLWDPETLELIGRVQADDAMWKVEFSNDSSKLVTVSRRSTRIFDVDELLQEQERIEDVSPYLIPNHTLYHEVFGVSSSRDPSWIDMDHVWGVEPTLTSVSVGTGDRIMVASRTTVVAPDISFRINLDEENRKATVEGIDFDQPSKTLDHENIIQAAISPDSGTFVVAEATNFAHVYRKQDWSYVGSLDLRQYESTRHILDKPKFAPDGSEFAITSQAGIVYRFDTETLELIGQTRKVLGTGRCLAYSRDKDMKYIASGGSDDIIAIWKRESGDLLHICRGHRRLVFDLHFNEDATRLLSVSRDDLVKLWDVESGTEILTIYSENDVVVNGMPVGAVFAPDDKLVYVMTNSGRVQTLSALPWNQNEYPQKEHLEFAQRVELYKRRQLMGTNIDFDAISQTDIVTLPNSND